MQIKRLILILSILCLTVMPRIVSAQTIPEEARRHMARGQAAVEMAKSAGDYALAAKEFEQAARLAPDWADAYYSLGMVQEKAGKYSDAVTSLRQYLRLTPNTPDAQKIREQIYKLEYKAEQVLSVPEIIDVLVSFSNKELWEKIKGECLSQPFAFIRRNDSNSVVFPYLYGLEWGPDMDMRSWNRVEIEGRLFKMLTNTMCGATDKAGYCHFRCLNEIEVVSRTHVRIRQQVRETERSIITPPVRNGMYSCEYRKK